MSSVIKNDFLSRCSDIRCLHGHLINVSNSNGTVKISSIIKSSIFIALYNNIEATFYSLFERIHSEASKIPFPLLGVKLATIFKEYYFDDKNASNDICHELNFPILKVYIKKKKIFSGNLDVRRAMALFKVYGIEFIPKFSKKKSTSLVIIKNKRNAIAHGELSFPDAGKSFSYQRILELINDSEDILSDFIEQAELYLIRLDSKSH